MFAVSRYAAGSSLLVLSLLIGCDHNMVEPTALFRVADPPSSASAVAASESRIDVSWPDNSATETGFEVHRSTTGSGGTFTLLATTGANVTSYSDAGLAAETQYCYEVRSFRRTGKQTTYSTFTGAVCATTLPLPAPSGATATAVSGTRVDVAWQDNSTSESGFELHRSTTGLYGTFGLLASTGAGVTSYNDVGLTSSAQYCYKVRASQASGGSTKYSEFSAAVCASTGPPKAPQPFAMPAGSHAIRVSWSVNPLNTDGFRVERSLDGGVSWTTVGVIPVGDWYQWDHELIDAERTPEQQVCYRVFAFNGWGDSGPSNPACTAPPIAPTGLRAMMVDSQTIDFVWSDNSAVEDGYALGYFGYNEGGWIVFHEIWEVQENTTSARVTSVEIGLSEDYCVVAVKDGGYSDFLACAIPDPAPVGIVSVGATAPGPARAVRPVRVFIPHTTTQRPPSTVAPRR
jgi:hypothetical protein